MTWDYRVVRKRDGGGDETYGIHECFFDDEDRIWACAEGPETVIATSLEELRDILVMMLQATTTLNPVVDFDLVPELGAIDPITEQLEQINEGTLETIPLAEMLDRWLGERDGSVTCATCDNWAWRKKGQKRGKCRARPVAVRDTEFNVAQRHAYTRAGDWCSRWEGEE